MAYSIHTYIAPTETTYRKMILKVKCFKRKRERIVKLIFLFPLCFVRAHAFAIRSRISLKFQRDTSPFASRGDTHFDSEPTRNRREISHLRMHDCAQRSRILPRKSAQTAGRDLIIDECYHRDPGNARYYYAVPVTARAVGKLQTR